MATFMEEVQKVTDELRHKRPEWRTMLRLVREGKEKEAQLVAGELGIVGNAFVELSWRTRLVPKWKKEAADLPKLSREWAELAADITRLRTELGAAPSLDKRRELSAALESVAYKQLVTSPAFHTASRAASCLACAKADGLCD